MDRLIDVRVIPHRRQRYDTCGDWQFKKNRLVIHVSRMKNADYEALVALHELLEAWLCLRRGISEEAVTAFDMEFERNRAPGNEKEPGDDPASPYRREHRFATEVERMMASELGIDWDEYERAVSEL